MIVGSFPDKLSFTLIIKTKEIRMCDTTNPVVQMAADAMEIINDFDEFGEVLQTDGNGEYGSDAPIEKLRTSVNEYREMCRKNIGKI